MMPELKPCPFCGGNGIIEKTKPAKLWNFKNGTVYELEQGATVIGCDEPGCILYLNRVAKQGHLYFLFDCEESAIDAWNRRAVDG